MSGILLVAEQANPEWVSGPLIGWQVYRELAHRGPCHLVTQVRNRPALERAGLTEGVEFTAIDNEALASPMHRFGELLSSLIGGGEALQTALSILPYYRFEQLVWRRFRDELKSGRYHLLHRVTPVSPVYPCLLASRCNELRVPFVIGPLNGGLPWPPGFEDRRWRQRDLLSYARDAYRLLPYSRSWREHSSACIIGSKETWLTEVGPGAENCIYIPENAVDSTVFPNRPRRTPGTPLKIVFVGRLVPFKGADILLEAARALVDEGRVEITLIGSGPEEERLRAMASECKPGGVRFLGWRPHHEIHEYLADSDLFVFPSVREFGGAVVLEAMAMGVPPVVIRYGGPAEFVTDETGYLVELGSKGQLVERLKNRLAGICQNPGELVAKGYAAKDRVERFFTWQAKVDQFQAVYEWVQKRSGTIPNFGQPMGCGEGSYLRPERA